MPKLDRILVPVDFTRRSQPALDYALFLAESVGATIDVLHVWEPPRYVARDVKISIPGETRETLREYMEAQAETALREFMAEQPDGPVTINWLLQCGVPAPAILDVAADGDYDLIVVGTEGRSGLVHFLVGSVAENVVRNSTCPVLTIRAPAEDDD